MTKILRDLIKRDGLRPGDLLFPGEKGGLLAGSVFRRVWNKARKAVLEEREYRSPVGKRVYGLNGLKWVPEPGDVAAFGSVGRSRAVAAAIRPRPSGRDMTFPVRAAIP
ncbi:hypothetical protein FHS39_001369 [Streptomyces olivoverticillatus]|uniref:Uncharacterized protein n=1 Tax=Streptomyces olivoverticillatus TaxID=66427 RepID=A0A7W7LLA5_9ACTN|nr:hypothetical protein [Streptomyces olivoverticillatus]MBB4892358.1 hypothetical protein [Streptomyces olivoverticillatus]